MLKCFDYKCNVCGREDLDVIKAAEEKTYPCGAVVHEEGFISPSDCPGTMERAWLMGARQNQVHGDEIDVTIQHGLCWPDGTPRRFRSREELKRVERNSPFTQHVEHKPGRGTDKSKHTQRWT